MKPILKESEDKQALQTLGRASVHVVHDLKNQLNGLKLYATFLRKRLEKSQRPEDELETVNKLIAGIDRTAADLSLLADYGRPVELSKVGGSDLQTIMQRVIASVNESASEAMALSAADSPLVGEFDPALLAEALKSISVGALKFFKNGKHERPLTVSVTRQNPGTLNEAVIEWDVGLLNHDPFRAFAGTDEIRISLAGRIIEAHGGTAELHDGKLRVRLPLK